MKIPGSNLLLAAVATFLIALLHIAIIFIGRKDYGYLSAGQLITLVEKDMPIPAIIPFGLALIFVVCGGCDLSGAVIIPPLPLYGWDLSPSAESLPCAGWRW